MLKRHKVCTLAVIIAISTLCLFSGTSWGQVTASMSGSVKDASGAVVPDAAVTVKNTESGFTRSAQTDANGNFNAPSIPVGEYEVTVEKQGFHEQVRRGINLVVGQQAVVNVTLEVGNVEQQVTVTAEAPLVNTTTSSTSGVISEEQVKDLPLNGRSFDQLIMLTVHTNNFTSNDARNAFSVAGKRPETNRFLLNGIDYIGADNTGQHILPYGSSQSLLGVDAIREFNVVGDAYGAEYGKRAGGQISIVTTSGTNKIHGDMFEFIRNSVLDAESFFFSPAPGVTPSILKRNQFGGALGGPIKKDKLFLFGNYEGFRSQLTNTTAANIPDAQARLGLLPNASGAYTPVANLDPRMLPLVGISWPDPTTFPGGCTEQQPLGVATGVCRIVTSPLEHRREDFGNLRLDYTISSKDSLSTNYLYDNGLTRTEGTIPLAGSESPLRSQVLAIQETRIISPTVLNVATLGFSRAYANSGASPYVLYNGPTPPIPAIAYFILAPNQEPGTVTVGGGTAGAAGSNSTITSGLGGTGRLIVNARDLYTGSDDIHFTKGNHNITAGVWLQLIQQNLSGTPSSNNGGATFSNLTTLLQGTVGTFIATPITTPASYRSTEFAAYVQDEFKIRPNLTMRLGLREESTNGWNEPYNRIANYGFTNGVMNTNPTVSGSTFLQNNAKALWAPRAGVAWDPRGDGKWSVRAGAGIYYDLLDNLAHRLSANPPYNARLNFTNQNFFNLLPLNSANPILPACTTTPPPTDGSCGVYQIAGVQQTAKTPTIIQWNLSIERQLSTNVLLHVGYVGHEGSHMVVLTDPNQVVPQVCASAAGCRSGGINTSGLGVGTVPQGTTYLPLSLNPVTGAPDGCRTNCDLADAQIWMYEGTSSYNSLDVFLQKRFSSGLTFRVNYTWAKILDDNSGLLSSQAVNEGQDLLNYYNLGLNRGPAAYNIAHQIGFNYSYQIPIGNGHKLLGNSNRVVDTLVSGWQWNGIFSAQTGFPFTPEVGFNVSGNGDSHGVDVPNVNPTFSGSKYDTRNTTHYFNYQAFTIPLPGTYGNVQRGSWTGPGLINTDMSLFKKFKVMENKNLEFRAEAFNLFNHANFATPSPNVFTSTGAISPTYGAITKLNGTNRQIQFALKFVF